MVDESTGRRSDVARNRERLIEAALRLFAEHGADVSPRTLAQEAGVGVGTLYRHFPDREALIEAAYRADLERLCAAAGDLAARYQSDVALRCWLGQCLEHAWTKQGLARALRSTLDPGGPDAGRHRLVAAVGTILDAGVAADVLRADIEPIDVLLGVTGVALATQQYADQVQASRLLDLMMRSYTTANAAGEDRRGDRDERKGLPA